MQEINRILSEGRLTLDELLEHLRGMGVDTISRSALGRQKQRIDKVAAKLRQSREMTEALVREIGPSVAEGQQGRLLVQTLRDLVFDHLAARVE
ncbi:MAG: phage protein Gp27 family protein, partial [Bilophila wadsworthia]